MKVLLILNREQEIRIIVNLTNNRLREKVLGLLQEGKDREAFNLIVSKAEVEAYLPRGAKPVQMPELILIEDLL